MVIRSDREEREYVLEEAIKTVRRTRAWPGMHIRVPIIPPAGEGEDPLQDAVEFAMTLMADEHEPMVVRVATVELVNLDDTSTWIITLPPPAAAPGLKRALAQAPGAGSW